MFGRLMPKEGKYFDLFNAHVFVKMHLQFFGNSLHNFSVIRFPPFSERISHEMSIGVPYFFI